MSTEGTMKFVVFESADSKPDAHRLADLFGEAAEWLRSQLIMEVQIGPKKRGKQEITDLRLALVDNAEYDGMTEALDTALQLYLYFDTNEYTGKG